MSKYHKIKSIFSRDPSNKHKTFLLGKYQDPEVEYLARNAWVFTEKVDGTNIRIMFGGGEELRIGGKSDNAQIHADLSHHLHKTFTPDTVGSVFDLSDDPPPVVLYGEGYGRKIQKGGGRYLSDSVSFILFDVLINGVWLERKNVDDVATKLGVNSVPIIGSGRLVEALEITRDGFVSHISEDATFIAEGLVCRPAVELLNRLGGRIITKMKHKDFVGVGLEDKK